METISNQYRTVAEALRDKIFSGKLKPSEKLPTERELSQVFNVSRVTVRRAMRTLEEEKLVRRIQGSGTYVSPNPSPRIPLMIDYAGSMLEHAPLLKRRTLLMKFQRAGKEIASELGVAENEEILYAERVDMLKTKRVAGDLVFISKNYAGGLTKKELDFVDFISIWLKKCKFSVKNCTQRIEAVKAGTKMAERLNLKKTDPVLKSTELYYAGENEVAGLFISYYNPEHICISASFNWSSVQIPQQYAKGMK